MKTEPPQCGTNAAYDRHRRQKEPTCQACRDAHNAYMRDYRNRQPTYAKTRANARMNARYRALAQLGENHPDRLAELIAEETPAGAARLYRWLSAARGRLAQEQADEYAELFAAELERDGLTRKGM